MVQIGKINRLLVKATQNYGIHLDGGESGDILLKGTHAAQKYKPGDTIDAFVYVDNEQRLLATSQKPYALVGEFATLRVVTNGAAGAFMDWGLENDLLVPKSEQQTNMREGKSYVVFIFLSNKTNRITASSKLDKFLNMQSPKYKEGEEVDLIIYAETDLGYSAIVNSSHIGMIYVNEVFQKLVIGQRLQGYVKKIREDLKIDLRLQPTGYQNIDDISEAVLNVVKNHGGMVAVTDKSPPEDIYALFGVSKKVFKKAIGALYKKRVIIIASDGIKFAG
ncbi:MAG: GntR family transcriptional regulator [Proteobacteria bacterium]|nr:GntR family transcriptional regulator [Pseudomonadota bacterium]